MMTRKLVLDFVPEKHDFFEGMQRKSFCAGNRREGPGAVTHRIDQVIPVDGTNLYSDQEAAS